MINSISDSISSSQQTSSVRITSEVPIASLKFTANPEGMSRMIGPVDDCVTSHGGLFFPYESSYAEYDIMIIQHYVERFRSLFFEDAEEYDDNSSALFQHWSGGICRTRIGTYLAHIMKSQLLAMEAGVSVYSIIRPDGAYQGSVLVGENLRIRLVGRAWKEAGTQDVLKDELRSCGSHYSSLRKILDTCGMSSSDPSQFKNLRSLSQAVNAGGAPGGMEQNIISKALMDVSFEERQDFVNVDTLKEVMSFLTSDADIPESWYMDKGFFFPANRYQEVLCRFGTLAPTFCPGGEVELRCCSIIGRGVPDSLKYDRASPPTYLNSQMVAVSVCANQWRDMLEHGHIRGIFNREVRGGRCFAGKEKLALWESFDDHCRRVIIEKGKKPETQAEAGGTKRAREEEVSSEARKKRALKFW